MPGAPAQYGPPIATPGGISASSSLAAATGAFHDYMRLRSLTENTIKSFLYDLQLLRKFLGSERSISQIGTQDLNDFLAWLVYQRGVPCSPKSYARRVTTLKVFFGWLTESGILAYDPAAPVIQISPRPPLPTILHDDQVERLLATTQALMSGERADPRPHLLVRLLLATGIKKSECMAIELNHIDRTDPEAPVLYIRYRNPRTRHKERKLRLPTDLMPVLDAYLARYQPERFLFPCSARNLEYVLKDVAQLAGLSQNVSFEILRWTAAVRDYRAGMALDTLRQKLGLSYITWAVVEEKIKILASPGL